MMDNDGTGFEDHSNGHGSGMDAAKFGAERGGFNPTASLPPNPPHYVGYPYGHMDMNHAYYAGAPPPSVYAYPQSAQSHASSAAQHDPLRPRYVPPPQFASSVPNPQSYMYPGSGLGAWPPYQPMQYQYPSPYGPVPGYPAPAESSKSLSHAVRRDQKAPPDFGNPDDSAIKLSSPKKKRIYTKQQICSVCQGLKLRVYKYLGAAEPFCNACNQHWQRNDHMCRICSRVDNLLGIASPAERLAIKEQRKAKNYEPGDAPEAELARTSKSYGAN
eukprot:TRINITY_DN4067_c0_g1_i7.p1 TRINITY_DN4067_c0_g1~~TRINITY_DN4067_c0_g1_i7.p1  ORF type:complete len:273 (+),score=32.82 TRINITY_DN4067_c0_g1_i7:86-904(+)